MTEMFGGWRKVVGVVAVVAVTLLLASGVRQLTKRADTQLPAEQVQPPDTPHKRLATRLAGKRPAMQLRPQLAGTYGLDYRFRFEAPGLAGARTAATLRWQGTWQLASMPRHPGWLAVRAGVDQWRANAGLRAVTGVKNADGTTVQAPFAMRVGDNGQIEEVRFSGKTPVPLQALLAGVAFATQWVRPDDATGAAWMAEERGLTGRFSAAYTTEDSRRVVKTWRGSGAEAGAGDPLGLHQQTRAEFLLDDGAQQGNGAESAADERFVQRLQWQQRGRMQPPVDNDAAATTFESELTLVRRPNAPASWVAGVDPRRLQPLQAGMAARYGEREPAPLDLAAAIEDLSELSGDDMPARRAELRRRIIAGLRSDPALVARVETTLRRGQSMRAGADSGAAVAELAERTLLEALVGAATGPAQQALAGLVADPQLTMRLRDKALMAASLLRAPTALLISKMLKSAAKEPDRASAIGVTLGALSRDLAARDEPRARRLVSKLIAAATDRSKTPGAAHSSPAKRSLIDECNWLAALGNTGDERALPAILAALGDDREDVRVSAAHALRFQDPAATHDAMVLRMAADESLDVRAALLHAARWQGPKARLIFVQKALRFDRSVAVRLEAAFTLASWSVTAPGVRKALAEALAVEESDTVQEALRNYLSPGRVAAPFKKRAEVAP